MCPFSLCFSLPLSLSLSPITFSNLKRAYCTHHYYYRSPPASSAMKPPTPPPPRVSPSPHHRYNVHLSRSLLLFVALAALHPPVAHAIELLKFNTGGWKLDTYDPDPLSLLTGDAPIFQLDGPITGLTVGLSHRWGSSEGFTYNFPTGNGVFDVDLVFAEIYSVAQKKGSRVFDVFIEDVLAFPNLDVFAAVGPNIELTKSSKSVRVSDGTLSIAFRKGAIENPMVSAIVIQQSNGTDLILPNVTSTEGVSEKKPVDSKQYDHQAHAKAGGPYHATDYNANGEADLLLDGTLSHSHYNNPDTGDTGRVDKYEWRFNDAIISSQSLFTFSFPVGRSIIYLTVTDQTGDTASAISEVIVLPSTAGGVYCYYYQGITQLARNIKADPLPDEGHSINVLRLVDDTIPYSKKVDTDGNLTQWAARCITDYKSSNTTQYKFSVQYRGSRALLFVNNGLKVDDVNTANELKTVNATVTVGTQSVPVEIWFYSGKGEPQLALYIDDKLAPPNKLSYKTSEILPTISGVSNTFFEPQGGVQMQIVGTGFFNGVEVFIGNVNVERTLISSTQIQVPKIPSSTDATGTVYTDQDVSVKIVVTNRASKSNLVIITYTNDAKKGVAWDQTFLTDEQGEKYPVRQASSIKIGPDAKYYVGSLSGFVTRLQVGKDLRVESKCDSVSLTTKVKRAVLGLAFNYASNALRVYVSTSTIYWVGTILENDDNGWANGAIESLVDSGIKSCGGACLCREATVVSGLPVSNHDHAVNGLLFVNGDLLIATGGMTNAGVAADVLGGQPETPLSGGILIARLSKSGFDGRVTYDQYADAAAAQQTGGDVDVYAAGMRNCFSMMQHSNGQIWATDNGANVDYGDISTGCDSSMLFAGSTLDEVNLVVEGKYYGHPNRNRGRTDPLQCVYGGGDTPRARLPSSTTGVLEYLGNAFSGTLQGKLILSRYTASGNGQTWMGTIGAGGSLTLEPMTTYSALSLENGLFGELMMPRVQADFVSVLKPIYAHNSGEPLVLGVSPGRGKQGFGVLIGGEDFAEEVVVLFGGVVATNVNVIDSDRIQCAVPEGSGVVEIEVIVNGASSRGVDGKRGSVRFVYV